MKKLFLLLLLPIISSAQLNFGAKAGWAVIDNVNDGNEILGLERPFYFSGLIEYKQEKVSYEFEMLYYKASGTQLVSSNGSGLRSNSDVKAIIPSVSIKYYPDPHFNVKTGIYYNSTSLDYSMNGTITGVSNNIKYTDTGILLGMEVLPFEKIIIDARFLIDAVGSDDIRTKHILIGIGYKF